MSHRTLTSTTLWCLTVMCACAADSGNEEDPRGWGGGAVPPRDAGAAPGRAGAASGAAGSTGGSGGSGASGAKAGAAGVNAGGGVSAGKGGAGGQGGAGAAAAGQPFGQQLQVSSLEVAQTHVLPPGGRAWKLPGISRELHLVGRRATLMMLKLDAPAASPALEAWDAKKKLGSVSLDDPSKLPPTEAGGAPYATDRHSATLPAEWIVPGLRVRVTSADRAPSEWQPVEVGAEIDFDVFTLPFYLFGADDTNSPPISQTAKPDQKSADELFAKWPVSRVSFRQHPAKRIDWPYIVVGPRNGQPAMRVENKDQQKDSYAVMSAVLATLSALREANGDTETNSHAYAPLMMLTASGKYEHPGGGLGGGSRGTGDASYGGIFLHEQGHAFGMPHAAGAFDDGEFPYAGGSMQGSSWAYDAGRRELLSTLVPAGAESAKGCAGDGLHRKDAQGRCVKQDPMQSGSGDQAPGYKYTAFSDFNAAMIQRYFEGETTLGGAGEHEHTGGTVFVDSASPTGYSRWDSLDRARVAVKPETTDKGLFGLDGGLPTKRDVKVHTVVFTISAAGTPGTTQLYPTLSYTGNLVRQIDPTSAADRATIAPNTGPVPWYCHASGCDYTVRVTYASGAQAHVLARGGFRAWFKPTSPVPAASKSATDDDSYRVFGVSVPGDEPLAKVEVLDTPMGWSGVPEGAPVLLSR